MRRPVPTAGPESADESSGDGLEHGAGNASSGAGADALSDADAEAALSGDAPSCGGATSDALLSRLAATLDARRGADPDASYVASLFERGEDTILKKIGEEAVELILAARGEGDARLVSEAADVWFHTLVLLSYRGLGPNDILNELARREGVSGHTEKAARDVIPRDGTSGDVARGDHTP